MEGVADLAALGLDEGVAHAAADDQVVDLLEHVLEHGELGRDLGTADDRGEGVLGVLEDVVDGLDLTFHQVAEHLVVGEVVGDEGGGAVGTVGRTESVVDVAVGVGGEGLDEVLLAGLDGSLGGLLLLVGGILGESAGLAFLLGVEAEVLEQKGLTRLEGGDFGLGLLAVGSELHRSAEALGHVIHDVLEGELVSHALRTTEVRHDDEGTTPGEYLFESRHRPADAGVVGNLEILIERNVEVHAHDRLLAGEIVGIDELLHKLL